HRSTRAPHHRSSRQDQPPPNQYGDLHDEANPPQLDCVGKRISSHGHEIREFALWFAEIRSGPSAGVRCYENGLCRECSPPSLLSCECVATNPAVMKRLKTTKPTAGKAVQVLV